MLSELGLEQWQPPEPLTYERTSKDVFGAGRLDAEHFKEKYVDLALQIENTGASTKLGDLLVLHERGKQPSYSDSGLPVVNSKHVVHGQIQINDDNRFTHSEYDLSLRIGDVAMNGTGVGTIGRAAPYLFDFESVPDNHVTVLRPIPGRIDPVYLSVFLNSHLGQMQVEQRLRGSSGQIELYPADIARFSIWDAPEPLQKQIRTLVLKGFDAKQRSIRLLESAKQAVEIAIEESEEAAIKCINTASERYA